MLGMEITHQMAYSSTMRNSHSKIGPQATFKQSRKANQIDTSQSLLQSAASMSVPGMDQNWANTQRNKFLDQELGNVLSRLETTKKFENGRLVRTFEYIEKENTSSKDLHYMKEFVPLDIEEHKVNLSLEKSSKPKPSNST